jgi:hypothetical protein
MLPPELRQDQREILHLTKARFQYHMITVTGQVYERVVVRAAVLKPGSPAKILMLRRKRGASADGGGLFNLQDGRQECYYELPGANVKENDDSIMSVLSREVGRASGLTVHDAIIQLTDVTLPSLRRESRRDGGRESILRDDVQIAYVVTTHELIPDQELRINYDEYSEAAWVDLTTLETLPMADETHGSVREALEMCEYRARSTSTTFSTRSS